MESRIKHSLRAEEGAGVVRLELRFSLAAAELWSTLTEPAHFEKWLGTVSGDLRAGGQFSAHFFASGWEGTGVIKVCDPPRRLLLHTLDEEDQPGVMEITLTPHGESTVLVFEDRGMPLDLIAAYGAGDQIHVEDLAAYINGAERCDARARWSELHPAFLASAEHLG